MLNPLWQVQIRYRQGRPRRPRNNRRHFWNLEAASMVSAVEAFDDSMMSTIMMNRALKTMAMMDS